MQEIGYWTTAEGSAQAIVAYDSELQPGERAEELPSWLGGALSGAASGAAMGSAAGPYGALIGAAAGGVLGGATAATAPAASKPPNSSSAAASPGSVSGTNAAQALQQLAAVLPLLMQLVSASGRDGGKKVELAGTGVGEYAPDESLDAAELSEASSQEGAWVVND